MKKNIKKILSGTMSFIILISSNSAYASTKQTFEEINNFSEIENTILIEPRSNRYYNTSETTSEKLMTTIKITESDISNKTLKDILVSAILNAPTAFLYSIIDWFYSMGVPGVVKYYRSITYIYQVDRLTQKRTLTGETWNMRVVSTTNGGTSKTFEHKLRIK